jgi:Nuclear protein 96
MYRHDHSLSFHLAAVISSLRSLPVKFSPALAEALCDSYTSQLVSCGMWEWGVFTSLYMIQQGDFGSFNYNYRVSKGGRAKELVLRHFTEDDALSSARRRFLEAIGVPWHWFEEALAYRYGYEGLMVQCINHMSDVDALVTSRLLENYLLPSSFFLGTKHKVAGIAEVFHDWDHDSLAVTLPRIFSLESSVCSISGVDSDRDKQKLQSIRSELEDVESFLLERQSRYYGLTFQMLPMLPPVPAAPTSALVRACVNRLGVIKRRTRSLLLPDVIRGNY